MAETPPGSFPVVSEAMVIRFRLGALIAIAVCCGGGLIGGAVWTTKLAYQLDNFDKRLGRIEKALGIDTIAVLPLVHPVIP